MDKKIKNMFFSLSIMAVLSLVYAGYVYITQGWMMADSVLLVMFFIAMPIMTLMMFFTWDVDYGDLTSGESK